MSKVVKKYLTEYAEPEIQALRQGPISVHYQQVLVIPACNEATDFLTRLPPVRQPTLLILVINQAPQARPQVTRHNQELAQSVAALADPLWSAVEPTPMALFRSSPKLYDILLIDRFSPGHEIPENGGVGQARKIGADLALSLIEAGTVQSPWIYNTDADTDLPTAYFQAGQAQHPDAAAVLFPFRHCTDLEDPVGRATHLYEFSLFYYVAGLRWAGSPYAFQTVGSSFAVHAKRYAQVRGFPKRAAAEDFYMLNKLAKVARIVELDCAPISIRARTSDRVPFGTGAAVSQMLEMKSPVHQHLLYDPQVFACLKSCLAALGPLRKAGVPGRDALWRTLRAQTSLPLPADQLVDALCSIGIIKALEHSFRQSRDHSQFERQIHNWFDAFRTLKLIHLLRDEFFPSMPLQPLLTQPLFGQIATLDPRLNSIRL